MATTVHHTHARTHRNQQKSVTTFFHANRHAPERPPKTLSMPPHDAPGRLPRLPSCARLVAASQAARGAFLSPPPPLLLLLLLLGCCWKGPPGTPEQARERPPPAIRAATPAAAPAHTLRPSPPLLPPPWQPLWRPHQSVEPLYQTWQRHTGEGRNEAKGRVRGWKWTPEGGQGWGGGGGCARGRDGGAEARRSSGRPRSRGRTGPGEGAAHLRRGPEAR